MVVLTNFLKGESMSHVDNTDEIGDAIEEMEITAHIVAQAENHFDPE
jgi:hypothetical protein